MPNEGIKKGYVVLDLAEVTSLEQVTGWDVGMQLVAGADQVRTPLHSPPSLLPPPPPFWGTPKLYNEGNNVTKELRILVLNSYPDPPTPF